MRTPDRLTIKTAAESPWAECEFSSIAEAIACAYNTAIHDAIALNHPALTRADGAAMIAFERRRQVDAEGWTPEHDDEHGGGELVDAAVAYLRCGLTSASDAKFPWPWATDWWKPSDDPITNLVRAGALIAAEIDRLLREATR